MKQKYVLLGFLITILSTSVTNAVYDSDFRECLANKIYNDCPKNLTWTSETVYYNDGRFVIRNGDIY